MDAEGLARAQGLQAVLGEDLGTAVPTCDLLRPGHEGQAGVRVLGQWPLWGSSGSRAEARGQGCGSGAAGAQPQGAALAEGHGLVQRDPTLHSEPCTPEVPLLALYAASVSLCLSVPSMHRSEGPAKSCPHLPALEPLGGSRVLCFPVLGTQRVLGNSLLCVSWPPARLNLPDQR